MAQPAPGPGQLSPFSALPAGNTPRRPHSQGQEGKGLAPTSNYQAVTFGKSPKRGDSGSSRRCQQNPDSDSLYQSASEGHDENPRLLQHAHGHLHASLKAPHHDNRMEAEKPKQQQSPVWPCRGTGECTARVLEPCPLSPRTAALLGLAAGRQSGGDLVLPPAVKSC